MMAYDQCMLLLFCVYVQRAAGRAALELFTMPLAFCSLGHEDAAVEELCTHEFEDVCHLGQIGCIGIRAGDRA